MARSCTRDEPYQQSRYMESAMSCSKAKKRSARTSLPPQGCCLCAKGTQMDINPHSGDGAHALLSPVRTLDGDYLHRQIHATASMTKCAHELPHAMSNHVTI